MVYIAIAAFCYSLVAIFAAVASRKMDTNLVAAFTNLVAAIIPTIVVIPLLNKNILNSSNSKLGLLMAVLAGIFIAFFTMAIAKSYSMNKVSVVAPLVFGGTVFLSAILSTIFLKEKITLTEGAGLVVVLIGLGIITYARLGGK